MNELVLINMVNILRFKPLKCEDVLLFCVLNSFKQNFFEFWTLFILSLGLSEHVKKNKKTDRIIDNQNSLIF